MIKLCNVKVIETRLNAKTQERDFNIRYQGNYAMSHKGESNS